MERGFPAPALKSAPELQALFPLRVMLFLDNSLVNQRSGFMEVLLRPLPPEVWWLWLGAKPGGAESSVVGKGHFHRKMAPLAVAPFCSGGSPYGPLFPCQPSVDPTPKARL